jgi:hypothetical protein
MDSQEMITSGPLDGDLTIIELEVKNAKKLFNAPWEADKWCKLADNAGKNSGEKLKNFESGVFPNSVVLWLGTLKKGDQNKGYSLTMDAIEITGVEESSFFEGKLQVGNGKGIIGWTTDFHDVPEEKYNLYFTLTNDEGLSKQIKIDPRLKGTAVAVNYLHYIQGIVNRLPIDKGLLKQLNEAIKKLLDNKQGNKG